MDKFIKIFKSLNFKFKIPETKMFEILLKSYLDFIDDENDAIIEKIYFSLKENYSDNKTILFNEMKVYDDGYYLIALFIFKSTARSSLFYNSNINSLTNDEVLNNIIEGYKNLYIFYLKKEIDHPRLLEIRGELFKILNILVLNNIIQSKKIYISNKTIEYLSFDFSRIYLSDIENLKISSSPLKLTLINENYYMTGEFFTMVKKVFIENTLSNYYFKLNNMEYLENLIRTKNYLNIHDLKEALDVIEDKKFKFNNVKEIIKNKNKEIEENIKNIKNNNKEINNFIIKSINIENLSFLEIKKKVINLFIGFVKKIIENKEISLNKEEEELKFLTLLHHEFRNIFNNAYLKIKFKNLKEFIEWKTNLKEFGYIEEKAGIFKKITGNNEKIEINEKINPNKISFLSFLFILNKKEITQAVLKTISKLAYDLKDYTNFNEIEFEEDSFLDKNKIAIISVLKFNNFNKNDLKLYKIKQEIQNLIKDNSRLQSEISKISNLYNLFILYNFIKNNFILDKYGNAEVYFLIFFDFRGRCYYDSIISPTNNKISRFIFNYGELDTAKIKYKANEISTIIQNYEMFLNIFKKRFNIEKNSTWINDTLFWLMLSLGKITIKKKKKIEIKEFLDNAIETVKNTQNLDYTDQIEYNYIIKIVNSLQDEKILRRTILKDATASFFQNLIRVLGPKNDEISKMANLNSTDSWFDWYSYILDEWLKSEKNQNLITENHKYFNRSTTKRTDMTSSYEATFPTLIEYFEEDLIKNFNICLNDEIYQIFIRFYKFVKEKFKNNPEFIKSSITLDKEFKDLLKNNKNIVIISRLNDTSNLTYYKTHTKHFDFIIKVENNRKRIIKNYKQLSNEIDKRKSMTALKANLIHFVDAVLIRDINSCVYYFNRNMYMSIHDSFMVDFTEVSEFIQIANQCVNENPFTENLVNYEKKFFSLFIFL